MKSVNELRIPAYVIFNMSLNYAVDFYESRKEARKDLKDLKAWFDHKYKIVKLAPEKFVR